MTQASETAGAQEMAQAMLGAVEGLDAARMRAAFEAYLESWRQGDSVARAALFAPDAVVEDPVGSPPLTGIDALKAFWCRAEAQGYSFAPRLDLFIPAGREALARFAMGMSRPGEGDLELTIHEVLAFDPDYRIKSLRAFFGADSLVSATSR